jgi:hypothetical protein
VEIGSAGRVTVSANDLTGPTLASNVVSSSLTSVGTLSGGAVPTSLLTGTTLPASVVSSSLTSVGTLTSLNVTGDLTVDTNTLKVNSSTNRVGVGTASPSATLDVQATTGTAMRITNTGTGDSFVVEDSASTDSTPFVIDSAGNVGIGGGTIFGTYGKVLIYGDQRTAPTLVNDGVIVAGRAGGISGYSATLTPTTLNDDRTITLPDKTGTVALTSDLGLVLIKTQTIGSGVSSVTISDAFSSTYDNYKIILNGGVASASTSISLQLGSSTTGYYAGLIFLTYSTSSVTGAGTNNGGAFSYAGVGTTNSLAASIELLNPFNTKTTGITSQYIENGSPGSGGTYNGFHNSATSYTAFTLSSGVQTMTGGTIRVYGYRNS